MSKLNRANQAIYDLRQEEYDLYQFSIANLFAKRKDSNVDNETILIELTGINIAAIIGDKAALVAKYMPIRL